MSWPVKTAGLCSQFASSEARPTNEISGAENQKKHGRRDLNPQQAVLETAALPIELLPYASESNIKPSGQPSEYKLKRKYWGANSPGHKTGGIYPD